MSAVRWWCECSVVVGVVCDFVFAVHEDGRESLY